MQYFTDYQEYLSCRYRRDLRYEADHLGVLLLLFFAVELIVTYATDSVLSGDIVEQMLLSGVITTSVFFLCPCIYCLCRRMSFARLFPFKRIGGGMLVTLCVIGLTLSLMSNMAVDALTDVFSLFGVENKGGDAVASGQKPPVLLCYISVAVLPALAEEFAFRGVIMGSLRKYSDALALVVSSSAFALMHGNFVQMPFTFCCGLVIGFIAVRTNSLLPGIIIHFLNNAFSITFELLQIYDIFNVNVRNLIYYSAILILSLTSILLIRVVIRKRPEMFRFTDSDTDVPFRDKMKTIAKTPSLIAFAGAMLLYAVYVLVR